jgi:hypothetical protein
MSDRPRDRVGEPDLVWIAPRGDAPFVRLAAEAIAPRVPRRNGAIDVTRSVIATPSGRGGRMLEAQLLSVAEAEGLRLDPPAVVTAQRLADRLLEGEVLADATMLERTVAWRRALGEASESDRNALGLDREGPAVVDAIRTLAATAITLEDELGREGRTFEDAAGGVPAAAALLEIDSGAVPDEAERWAALGAVRARVTAALARAGLAALVDRERMLLRSGRPRAERLFLVGFLEVSGAVRALASRVATTVIVPEPADPGAKAARDAFGVPKAGGEPIPIVPLESIRVAGGPRSQAEAALEFLAECSRRTPQPAIDEIAIGVADENLFATVAASLRDEGLGGHQPGGRPILRREPLRALAAALAWRTGRDAESLATLVRGPRAGAAIRGVTERDPVAELDAFLAATCLVRLDGELPAEAKGCATVERIVRWVDDATRPLEGLPVGPKAAAAAIVEVLATLGVDRDADLRGELEKLLQRLAAASPMVVGEITPAEAASLVLDLAAAAREPVDPRGDEIELLGWLELLLEPAPHLCIVGMNEGCVPGRGSAPAWLTGSMTTALGLPDAGARLARDAAILEALLRFRPDLRLVFGRSSPAGDPLLPSRLLLGGTGRELAARVQSLFAAPPTRTRRGASAVGTGFTVPAPAGDLGVSIDSISVTSLRTYLEDPVRFWLERHERIAAVDPRPAELDSATFGTLVHDVLDAAFADATVRASTVVAEVRDAFLAALDRLVLARLGPRLRPALRMQVRSMRTRLERLAAIETASRQDGWLIHDIERSLPESCTLVAPDGVPVRITGRMDRVERRDSPDGPEYRILDAKTSEEAKSPREAHFGGPKSAPAWVDLQLPLYRHFAAAIVGADPARISTGYLQLPADPRKVAIELADFTPEEHASAVAKAIETIGLIRAGSFARAAGSGRGPNRDDDPLRFILQTPVFAGGDGEEEA